VAEELRDVSGDQLVPDVVARTCTGELPSAAPTATHAILEHETVFTVPEACGIATGTHWDPPSVVTTSKAEASGIWEMAGLPPIATHVVADSQETERRTPVPPLTSLSLQV